MTANNSHAQVTRANAHAPGEVADYVDFAEVAAPATPAAGFVRQYAKSDGKLYQKDDAGTETDLAATAGASSFSGCRVYNSTTQSIANSSDTVLTFDSEEFDADALHSTATNTGRITVNATGKWRFHATGLFSSSDLDGARRLRFRVDGTTGQRGGASIGGDTAAVAAGVAPDLSAVLDLTSGQYVEVVAFQNSGSSLTIGHASTAEFQTIFEAEFLGA